MLGNVICEEITADDADPELDTAARMEVDPLEDELPIELLGALMEGTEVLEVALVI
jgi:hypothetical protein